MGFWGGRSDAWLSRRACADRLCSRRGLQRRQAFHSSLTRPLLSSASPALRLTLAPGVVWGYVAAYAAWALLMVVGQAPRGALNDLLFSPLYLAAALSLWIASRSPALSRKSRHGLVLLSLLWASYGMAYALWGVVALWAFPPLDLLAWILYNLYYPLILGGLWLLVVWPGSTHARLRLAIDALVVIVAAATLQWYFVLRHPAAVANPGDVFSRLGLPFPYELLIAAGAAMLLHRPIEQERTWGTLLGTGTFVATVADFMYKYSRVVPKGWPAVAGDVLLAIGLGLIATAGHQLARRGRTPETVHERTGAVSLTTLPYIAIAIVGFLLLAHLSDRAVARPVVGLVLGGAALALLLVARLHVATREVASEAAARTAQNNRFRALVQRSSDAILVVDSRGLIQYASPAFDTIVGLTDTSCIGTPLSRFIGDPAASQMLRLGGAAGGTSERWSLTNGDRVRVVDAMATDLRHEPDINGLVVNLRDVTERLQLEEQLRQAQKLELVGRVSSSVAHDFNNVLGVVLGNASMARLRGDSAEEWEAVSSAAERGAALARQLLAFSRPISHEPRIMDLGAEVRRMQKTLLAVLPRSIELQLMPATSPLLVRIDDTQIERVILNLALNARDAMPSGGRLTITVREEIGQAGDTWAVVVVADSGHGMDAATLQRAFDPFFTTKSVGSGTGLGLSTTREVVAEAGGDITIASHVGQGTIITLRFPVVAGAALDTSTTAPVATATQGDARVLVVEDENAARLILTRYLSTLGFQVVQARDGVEALERLDALEWEVDVVITDLIMPRMSGDLLTRKIRERTPELPVLCMSGTPGLAEGGMALWTADYVLQKPVALDLVARRIAEVTRTAPAASTDA